MNEQPPATKAGAVSRAGEEAIKVVLGT